jgi:hypothetical protein
VADFTGMGGSFQTEWVAGFHRNRWQPWTGIHTRKELLEIFNLPKSFSRAFDLIHVPQQHDGTNVINLDSKNDITFVELKTTKKSLPNNPKGFFFGATENEFNLAKILGDQYLFCFVSLHPDTKSYSYKSLSELDSLIKNKRVQYQINLRK